MKSRSLVDCAKIQPTFFQLQWIQWVGRGTGQGVGAAADSLHMQGRVPWQAVPECSPPAFPAGGAGEAEGERQQSYACQMSCCLAEWASAPRSLQPHEHGANTPRQDQLSTLCPASGQPKQP